MMNKSLLFYPACDTHVRTFELIRNHLVGCEILSINIEPYRPEEKGLEETLRNYGHNYISIKSPQIPAELFSFEPDVVVFGCGGEDPFTINLCFEAVSRNIPTIAYEEVNQLSLNDSIINFYTLPFDTLAVGSDVENRLFAEQGSLGEIITTGLPQNELVSKASPVVATEKNQLVGDKKALLYTTTPLQRNTLHSIEMLEDRIETLALIRDGLPEDWQLIVKLHPREDFDRETKRVKEVVTSAIVVGREKNFEDLIGLADCLISRGNSHTCLQALIKNVPVIIHNRKYATLFSGLNSCCQVNSSAELSARLSNATGDLLSGHQEFLDIHMAGDEPSAEIAGLISNCKLVIDACDKLEVLYSLAIQHHQLESARRILKKWENVCGKSKLLAARKNLIDLITPEASGAVLGRNLVSGFIAQLSDKFEDSLLKSKVYQCLSDDTNEIIALESSLRLHKKSNIRSFGAIYFRLVSILLKLGRKKDAFEYIEKYKNTYFEWVEYQVLRAEYFLSVNNRPVVEETVEIIKDLSETCSNPWLHHDLGLLFSRLSRYEEAKDAFGCAIKFDQENPWPYYELGRIAVGENNNEAARGYFEQSIIYSPAAILPRLQLLKLMLKSGNIVGSGKNFVSIVSRLISRVI